MINFMLLIDGWLSSIKEGAMGVFESGLRTITFGLAKLIYRAIISVYNIFERLCHGRLLDDEMLNAFSERIGLVLGLVMVFIVLSSLLKMILDPDKISDKEMGGFALVKKAIIVIVMLGVSNFVFSFLYTFQKVVIDEHIITRLLLPVNLEQESLDKFGGILAEELFVSFYSVKTEGGTTEQIVQDCEGYFGEFRNNVIEYGNFELGYACLNESVFDNGLGIETYVMEYNWLLLIFVGVVVLFMLISYCISIGVRMVQLMFLEIIAPMAFVSYMAPKKDTMFSKWLKIYISTYIDVFLRIAIINFVVFVIATILDAEREGFMFWQTVGDEGTTMERGFIFAVLVIALLTFAKKAPDLIKDLFGSNASKLGLGFKSPKQIFDGMLGGSTIRKGLTTGAKVATFGTAMGLTFAGVSAVSRYNAQKGRATVGKDSKMTKDDRKKALKSAFGGAAMGMMRGLTYGTKFNPKDIKGSITKGFEAQRTSDEAHEDLVAKGGTLKGKWLAKLSAITGLTYAQKVDKMTGDLKEISDINEENKKAAEGVGFIKAAMADVEHLQRREAIYESDEERITRNKNSRFELGKINNLISDANAKADEEARILSKATGKSIEECKSDVYIDYNGIKYKVGSDELLKITSNLSFEAEDTSRRIVQEAETEEEFIARRSAAVKHNKDLIKDLNDTFTIYKRNDDGSIKYDSKGHALLQNAEIVYDGDNFVGYKFEYEDYNHNVQTEVIKGEDLSIMGLVQNNVQKASSVANNKNVLAYDPATDDLIKVGPFKNASDLRAIETYLNNTNGHMKNDEYYKSKAEDAAAKLKDKNNK